MLRIAPDLKIPPEVVTQTLGILAVRGAGKSNAAAVLAEELHRNRLPFVVVDPVGSWYGLRSSANGKGPGLPVPIFGGRHGDVPLERDAGETIADLVVDQRLSAVLDVSELSEGDKTRFLIGFGSRLYRRNEAPLHLILEEADDYAPQRPLREQARLLRVWQDIVRRGRARGLGITMVTQRSAVLNKDVLTQIETLIVLRTSSPQDRKAIAAWIEYHSGDEDVLGSLASLKPGEAWIWSPSFLKTMRRVQIRRRATFDSGATPKASKRWRRPATRADVDLDAVRSKLREAIQRAEADDPAALRRKIARLEHELREAKVRETLAMRKPKTIERLVVKPRELKSLAAIVARLDKLTHRAASIGTVCDQSARALVKAMAAASSPAGGMPGEWGVEAAPVAEPRPAQTPVRASDGSVVNLSVGQRRVLTAIVQHRGCSREQLTALTGYRKSTRDLYVRQLVAMGLVDPNTNGGADVLATQQGIDGLGEYEALPHGDDLRRYWLAKLPAGERRVLEAVASVWPKGLVREAISKATGYRKSTRDLYVRKLAARRLVRTDGASVKAAPELFS